MIMNGVRKNVLTVLSALVFAVLVMSCGDKKEAAGTSPIGGENKSVAFALASKWTTLNPFEHETQTNDAVLSFIYENPFLIHFDGTIAPQLFDSYEFAPDGLSFTVRIGQGAAFHDGKPVTADDVIFTSKLATSVDQHNNRRFIYASFAGVDNSGLEESAGSLKVEKVDNAVIRYYLKTRVEPDSLIRSWSQFFYVLPSYYFTGKAFKEISGSDFWLKPIGSGPAVYDSEVSGERIQFKANKKYHRGVPDWDVFTVRVVQSTNLLAGLISGDIDIVGGANAHSLPISDWELAKQQAGLITESEPGYGLYFIPINQTKEYITPRIREAFELAIDKQGIIKTLLGGRGEAAVTWVPSYSPYYIEYPAMEFDPVRARQILEEEGWDFNRTLKYIGLAGGNVLGQQITTLVQQYLQAVGVKLDITEVDSGTSAQMQAGGQADIGLMSWNGSINPNLGYYKVEDRYNYACIRDPAYGDWMQAAANAPTFDESMKYYQKIYEKQIAERPYIWLFFTTEYVGYNKKLSNVDIRDFWMLEYPIWEWKVD
jgi:peptide/nickel transport system substrate-binding protein